MNPIQESACQYTDCGIQVDCISFEFISERMDSCVRRCRLHRRVLSSCWQDEFGAFAFICSFAKYYLIFDDALIV